MPNLLILDDDESLLFALKYCFEEKGCEVMTFISAAHLLSALQTTKPDFILIDVYLTKDEHGGELCYHLKKNLRLLCPVFLFSSTLLSYEQFSVYKADGFILKRTRISQLIKIVLSYLHTVNDIKDQPQVSSPDPSLPKAC